MSGIGTTLATHPDECTCDLCEAYAAGYKAAKEEGDRALADLDRQAATALNESRELAESLNKQLKGEP